MANGNKLTKVDSQRGIWQDAFIKALRKRGNVREACELSGISKQAAYAYRKEHPEFDERWKEAIDDACDLLEKRAWIRAEQSDAILMFLLKAHRPEKYTDRIKTEHSGSVNLDHIDVILHDGGNSDSNSSTDLQ